MNNQHRFRILSSFVLLCLCLCTVPDLQAQKAKKGLPGEMSPPAGKALLFVVRPSMMGAAIGMQVVADENYLGKTKGKRFIYAYLDPGERTVVSMAENESELVLNVEEGEIYFLEQKVKMGALYARNKLILLSPEEGLKKIGKCRPAKDIAAATE